MSDRKYSQDFSGESPTQQHFKESCDINRIVDQYAATGVDPAPERLAMKQYGFATSKDFAEAQRQVAEVNSAFADLPSSLRAKYGNDPANWIEAIQAVPNPQEEITPPEVTEEPSGDDPAASPPETEPLDII